MKKLILTFLIFFSCLTIKAQCGVGYNYDFLNITDLEKRELKESISRVKYKHYSVIDDYGEITKGTKDCIQETIFNENGNVVKIINYNSNGEIGDLDVHEYEKGKIKFINHYRIKGKLFAKTAFIEQEDSIKQQRFLPNGDLNDQYFVRIYDQIGNLITEITKYHNKPNDIDKTTYTYDENNRIIRLINGSNLYKISYLNDTSKMPGKIEEIDLRTKKINSMRNFKLDSQGNVTVELRDNKITRWYEYEYDQNGNWIRKIEFKTEAKIPIEIIEREIDYY